MIDKKISVIIPIFDTNINYLTECFESINNQNYQNYEVILVNDCSRKFSVAQFINKYAKEHTNYKIINLSDNFGPGNARNIGLQNSTGEIIVYVDSDDYLLQNCFSEINLSFNEWPNLDILSFENRVLMSNGKLHNSTQIKFKTDHPVNINTWNNIIKDKCSVWAKAYSKKFLMDNDIWFEKQDMYLEDLYYQIVTYSKAKEVIFKQEILYILRETLNSRALSKFDFKKANDILLVMKKAYEKIKNDHNHISKNYDQYFSKIFYSKIESHIKDPSFKNSIEYKTLIDKARNFVNELQNKKLKSN